MRWLICLVERYMTTENYLFSTNIFSHASVGVRLYLWWPVFSWLFIFFQMAAAKCDPKLF